MKIPLHVQKAAGGPKPFAYVMIYSERYNIKGKRIRLFYDTGAHECTICETDAKVLGVRYNILGKPRIFKGVGGCSIEGYPLNDITLRFRNEKNDVINLNADLMFALRCIQKNKKAIEASKSIPSIIGTKFLIEHELSFHYDPAKKEAYFENNDE